MSLKGGYGLKLANEFLTEMVFDDDAKLFGFIQRYSEEGEEEDLKNHIVEYVTQSQAMAKQSQSFPN